MYRLCRLAYIMSEVVFESQSSHYSIRKGLVKLERKSNPLKVGNQSILPAVLITSGWFPGKIIRNFHGKWITHNVNQELSNRSMKKQIPHSYVRSFTFILIAVGMGSVLAGTAGAQPDPRWLAHDRERPDPEVIIPGTNSTQERAGRAPSDAIVLFDGNGLSHWASMDGTPSRWIVRDNYMECVEGSGYIRTQRNFGDCQLHIEWATPLPAQGTGQARGNSGVFFGLDRYEIQVLDSYQNTTYADGSAGSVYGQYPPLVNACRPPGQWQSYDVIFTAPRFDQKGNLESAARVTVLHNGVLIQNNAKLTGPTEWLGRPPYSPHPAKQPIALQDHGNPVRYRNIWIRELGNPGKPEYTLPDQLLELYTGTYQINDGFPVEITKEGRQLVATFQAHRFPLFAESKTHFFAKTTDVQCEFRPDDRGRVRELVLSVGEGGMTAEKQD